MSSSLPGTASAYFGAMVESYDSLIRRAVPNYEEITSCLVAYLPQNVEQVLELGCGTGNLSLALAERFPQAGFTFVDASPEMVELTRSRLHAAGPGIAERGRFLVSRFEELQLPEHSFDLVTSSFSLHHVRDKAALFSTILRMLRPGGTLRFADQLLGGSALNQEIHWSSWLAFCRQPGHCTEPEIQSLLEHAREHDHYAPLAEHFRMLEQAGFVSVDCVWRKSMWAIVTAEAP